MIIFCKINLFVIEVISLIINKGNFIMKIKKSTWMQYLLIYLMLIIPGSCLFAKVLLGSMKYYILIALYGVLYITKRKYQKTYAIVFCGVLLFIVLFQRLVSGGVGISAWLQFVVCILSAHFAIFCWNSVYCCFGNKYSSALQWTGCCYPDRIISDWDLQWYFSHSSEPYLTGGVPCLKTQPGSV